MIVREGPTNLLLMTQPDHAALSARLMAEWTPLREAPQREEVLCATAEHDNGWREPDAAPIVDRDGRVLDFRHVPDGVGTAVWPRGIERLAATPYVAALVAEHALHLYGHHRSDAAWDSYLADLARRRARHLERAGRSESELSGDYTWLRLGDLLSLMFCNAWCDEQAYGGYRFRLVGGSRLVVSPDPFDGRDVAFEIAARRLPRRLLASPDAALAAFQQAPVEAIQGRAVGA